MAKIVIHDNKYCQFITDDINQYNSLKRFLSYKEIGVEYTPAFRNGWNGITYLLDAKGFFYGGLLDITKEFCRTNDIEISEVEDRRKKIIKADPMDISHNLKAIGITPRDYQEEIVEKCLNVERGICRAATASGKSVCMAMIAARLNKPTLIYVIGLDLLKQFHDLFSKLFDEKIGYIGNGVCDVQRISIVSIWSIGAALKLNKKLIVNDSEDEESERELSQLQNEQVMNMLKTAKVHMFDESHVITTDTIKRIYKVIQPEHILGFSGTPYTGRGTDMLVQGILGEKVVDVSASRLIKSGVLPQPVIRFLPVPKTHCDTNSYQSVYRDYVVENDTRNTMIAENTKKLIDIGYTPLVLFRQIKHGNILMEKLREYGVKCEMLNGNDDLERRTTVKDMIEKKEINAILASSVFDIGVSIDILSALVLASPNKSIVKSLQRIGRCLRPYPGKEMVAVVDFVDQVKYLKKHSQIRRETYESEPGFEIHWPKGIK
jgi:superfamily II DNA or RNA helicase